MFLLEHYKMYIHILLSNFDSSLVYILWTLVCIHPLEHNNKSQCLLSVCYILCNWYFQSLPLPFEQVICFPSHLPTDWTGYSGSWDLWSRINFSSNAGVPNPAPAVSFLVTQEEFQPRSNQTYLSDNPLNEWLWERKRKELNTRVSLLGKKRLLQSAADIKNKGVLTP